MCFSIRLAKSVICSVHVYWVRCQQFERMQFLSLLSVKLWTSINIYNYWYIHSKLLKLNFIIYFFTFKMKAELLLSLCFSICIVGTGITTFWKIGKLVMLCMTYFLHFFSSFVMHQTFSQLCSFDYTTKTVQIYKAPWSILDKPRFPYRGLMLGESKFYKWDKFTFCKCSCAMFWGSVDTYVFFFLFLFLQIRQGTIYQLM